MAKKKVEAAVEEKESNVIEMSAEDINTEQVMTEEMEDMISEAEEELGLRFIEDLGFSVVPNLSAESIEAICSFVNEYDSWTDRYYAKAIATLNLATDLNDEDITSLVSEIDMIVHPFIYTVYDNIMNWNFVEDALKYYESPGYRIQAIVNSFKDIEGDITNAAEAINQLKDAVE